VLTRIAVGGREFFTRLCLFADLLLYSNKLSRAAKQG
jgi:hypothetical protein